MRAASTDWSVPAGANSSTSAASSASNSLRFSPATTTNFCARKPCFRAFWEEHALPSGVLGPHELAPLRRLAAARAGLKSAASVAWCAVLPRRARLWGWT
jgi:hypothetical protein